MVYGRIPWWLGLLLGVWVSGLTGLTSPSVKREVRLCLGLLSLVYLGLILVALGGDPRQKVVAAAIQEDATVIKWLSRTGGVIALIALTLLVTRPSNRVQLLLFSIFTLANAANCFALRAVSLGWALVLVASVVMVAFVRELRCAGNWQWGECLPLLRTHPSKVGCVSELLVGGTGLLLALLLVGTFRHGLRTETTRATSSHRFSAMPSQERIRAVVDHGSSSAQADAVLIDLAFGRRADVLVLLLVLAFLALAMTTSNLTRSSNDRDSDLLIADVNPSVLDLSPRSVEGEVP